MVCITRLRLSSSLPVLEVPVSALSIQICLASTTLTASSVSQSRPVLHVSGPLPIHIGQESSLSQAKAWPYSIPKPKTQSHLSNTDSFKGILDACKILKPLQPARNRARDSSGPCAPNTPNTQPAAALANGSLRCQVSTRRGPFGGPSY